MTRERTVYHTRPIVETGINPEGVDLVTWYYERLDLLGDTTIEPDNVTDGESWKVDLTSENEVRQIEGSHFTIQGTKVTRYNPDGTEAFSWTQPGIHQAETRLTLPTREGDVEVETSGFVGVVRDVDGNVLLTLAQEPYASAPKKALIRTPFQTSATKFKDLLDGDREKDPNLFDLLQKLGGSEDVSEMFSSGQVEAFPLPYADANRIKATNYGFAVKVEDPDLREELKNNGANRWCSPAEVKHIMRAGYLNGLTTGAIFATE